nr:hypothetical protein [Tanacetum cinerariifolium]
ASVSESAFVEEPVQTTSQMEEPSHSEFDTCAKDQLIVQSSQHPEWFSQQQKPPSPDYDWNKTVPAIHGSIQPWISEFAKRSDSRSSFNELIDTPLNVFNFLINRLKVDTLTPEVLAGPTYELMKGSCKSLVKLEYHLEEVFKATTDQLDWVNPEVLDVYSKRRIIAVTELKIVEWHNYKHLDWISRRVEDLQLGVESYQKRLNLTKPDTYRSDLNDGTLNDVCNALDDRLKGIQMQYLPTTIWKRGDKARAAAMIQAIDKMLKTRRIMRSLERFVGGRQYEGDFRMLQRTI